MAQFVTRIRLKSGGIVAMLKSGGVAADMEKRARGIQGAMPKGDGEKWVVRTGYSRDRAWALVAAGNRQAREAAANGAIQRGIGGGH